MAADAANHQERLWVGISLMASAETEAAVELIKEEQPDAKVSFRDVYYKIEREGSLTFDMEKLGDILGHDIETNIFLVNMSSYYGRIQVSDEKVEIFSEAAPATLRPQ